MEIRQLEKRDAPQFSALIVNMYSHLDNLEWFTPMPYDLENVEGMIAHPRFYIIGAFEDGKLVGVSSLDYKCGKLIGKVDFPADCDTEKLVEIGFNLVHFDFRGRKIMQQLIDVLLEKIKKDGFEWVFTKVYEDNIASNKSCFNKGFEKWCHLKKEVDKAEFKALSEAAFFSKIGKENAKLTLNKFKNCDKIIVEYNILLKKL